MEKSISNYLKKAGGFKDREEAPEIKNLPRWRYPRRIIKPKSERIMA